MYKIDRSLWSDTLLPCKIYWSFGGWKVFVSFRTCTVLPVATCGMLDECYSYRCPVQVKLNRGWARKCQPCYHSLKFSSWILRTASNLYKVGCGLHDVCFRMIKVVGCVTFVLEWYKLWAVWCVLEWYKLWTVWCVLKWYKLWAVWCVFKWYKLWAVWCVLEWYKLWAVWCVLEWYKLWAVWCILEWYKLWAVWCVF